MTRIAYFMCLFLAGIYAPVAGCGPAPVYPPVGMDEIQGMDVYAEGDSLHAVLVGKPANTSINQVAYLFSADAGASWSKPVIVNAGQDGKLISRRGNEAQVAAQGRNAVVVWRRGGELPETGPMVVAYSADGGASWRRGENPALGDVTENQSYLDLVADQAGHFHVVWLDDREEKGNTQGLRYARSTDGGRHWLGELTLDPAVCTCCWNRLAVLPGQGIAALYRDDDPHDMRLAHGPGDGGPWKTLGAVGAFGWRFNGCPHCGGGIAAGPGQRLHGVVWSGKEGAEGLYYLNSKDFGGHWSKPLRIAGGQSREGDIAVLGKGRVGVVFAGPAGEAESVQFMASDDAGQTWTRPLLLSAAGAPADHPRILATPQGFRVFWTEKRAAGGRVWAMQSFELPLINQKRKT